MSDFRSDTVTRPTPAMREAILNAKVGDDVYGDDPSVNQLEAHAARLLGFEAAVFATSGTQSNLMALLSQCERGDEAIVGQQWHTYRWEAGGMAVLGSIQPQVLEHADDATIPLESIESAIKPDDAHFARTRIICMENTTGGTVLPMDYLQAVRALATRKGLATHLDGARLFNAATEIGRRRAAGERPGDAQGSAAYDPRRVAREICSHFDTVSVCLSKGLGAPVGSLLLGSQSTMAKARRWRKMLGGGLRQAGLLAAAGLHALEHHIDRLADDHRRARTLAAGLAEIGAECDHMIRPRPPDTNIVFVDLDARIAQRLNEGLQQQGIAVNSRTAYGGAHQQRWVTHLDVGDDDIDQALDTVRRIVVRR